MASKNQGMSPVAAGVVGAVVGAAVGATAVVLSEEKNREALGKTFNDVKEKVEEAAGGVGQQAQNVAGQVNDKVDEAKKAVKSKL
jgi:gas vesicle protein